MNLGVISEAFLSPQEVRLVSHINLIYTSIEREKEWIYWKGAGQFQPGSKGV